VQFENLIMGHVNQNIVGIFMENGSGGFMGGRLSASLLFELLSQRYQISYSMEGSSASGSGTSSA
jgi:hypothetical protein